MKLKRDRVKEAAVAHTDLNIFYGVIALMEGGLLGSESYADAERIISICRRAGAKCLHRYDSASAHLKLEDRK